MYSQLQPPFHAKKLNELTDSALNLFHGITQIFHRESELLPDCIHDDLVVRILKNHSDLFDRTPLFQVIQQAPAIPNLSSPLSLRPNLPLQLAKQRRLARTGRPAQ
ncbi:hypothetical protein D3C77_492200 [compost metagenome]